MKLALLGFIAIMAMIVLVTANYKYPGYVIVPGHVQNGTSYHGLFGLIIFLFVFILIIQVLFGTLNRRGGGGGGGKGGGGHGGSKNSY